MAPLIDADRFPALTEHLMLRGAGLIPLFYPILMASHHMAVPYLIVSPDLGFACSAKNC